MAHYGENASPKAVRALLQARKNIAPFILAGEVERQLGELLGVKPAKNNHRIIQLAQITPSPRGGGDEALTPDPAAYVW